MNTVTTATPTAFSLPRRGAWIGGATAALAAGAMATAVSLKAPVATPLPATVPLAAPVGATAPATTPARLAQAAPAPQAAAPVCRTCGTVESVKAMKQKGQASGTGAVVGGVLGGVVGNQMGSGNGRKAMTVLGAVGGGLAGHEIEKRRNATTVYQVTVRLDDGSRRTVTRPQAWAVGQRVSVDGQALRVLTSKAGPSTS